VTASGMAAAYEAAAAAWSAGADPVYSALASAMLEAAGIPVHGARVLDVEAGTGAAARAALAAGAAQVVAVDLAAAMLRRCGAGVTTVVADLVRLPFRAGAFDLVSAACCLGHLGDPAAALRETRRVGAGLVASAFPVGWTHPAKEVVEGLLRDLGYVPPSWYRQFKERLEPRVGDPERLAGLARQAGYLRVTVSQIQVSTGIAAPEAMVDWRLGMAHLAPFVGSLTIRRREFARGTAAGALRGAPPLAIPLLVLSAR
jgi:SAM-dependent methyltransferase